MALKSPSPFWGPGGWKFLEIFFQWDEPFESPSGNIEDDPAFKRLRRIHHFLPGAGCKLRLGEYMYFHKESIPEIGEDRGKWLMGLHNEVNQRLGKRQVQEAEARRSWMKLDQLVSKTDYYNICAFLNTTRCECYYRDIPLEWGFWDWMQPMNIRIQTIIEQCVIPYLRLDEIQFQKQSAGTNVLAIFTFYEEKSRSFQRMVAFHHGLRDSIQVEVFPLDQAEVDDASRELLMTRPFPLDNKRNPTNRRLSGWMVAAARDQQQSPLFPRIRYVSADRAFQVNHLTNRVTKLVTIHPRNVNMDEPELFTVTTSSGSGGGDDDDYDDDYEIDDTEIDEPVVKRKRRSASKPGIAPMGNVSGMVEMMRFENAINTVRTFTRSARRRDDDEYQNLDEIELLHMIIRNNASSPKECTSYITLSAETIPEKVIMTRPCYLIDPEFPLPHLVVFDPVNGRFAIILLPPCESNTLCARKEDELSENLKQLILSQKGQL